jgi:hypothetical protein
MLQQADRLKEVYTNICLINVYGEIGYGTVGYLLVSREVLVYFVKEFEGILLLTVGSGSGVVLTCKLCTVTVDGTRGMG